MDDLISSGITFSEFSVIVSAYSYGYPLMQIPFGIIASKFGLKKVLSINLMISAVSLIPFLVTNNFYFIVIADLF